MSICNKLNIGILSFMKELSRKKRKKLKIFEIYSKNFDLTFPGNSNVYVCPICKRGTSHYGVLNGDLTEEHIIPRKLGGRISTLTCKDCMHLKKLVALCHLSASSIIILSQDQEDRLGPREIEISGIAPIGRR